MHLPKDDDEVKPGSAEFGAQVFLVVDFDAPHGTPGGEYTLSYLSLECYDLLQDEAILF